MEGNYPLARVCDVLGAPRSTIYHRRFRGDALGCRPGPHTAISDEELVDRIREALTDSPFAGEGYRKVRARLRREHQIRVGGKRVLRLMRRHGLLAPQRCRRRRKARPHDGTIIPAGPNQRWGTDATMAWTREDGWVWVFVCVDHYTAEAWCHVAKVGDRIAALQPVYDAVISRFGGLGPDVARGVKLRHDWGPQYRSHHFWGSIAWLGLDDDAAFVGEPETNGCAERFIRTLKEQCLWAELRDTANDLSQAVTAWTHTYNTEWLIQRHGHLTPTEAFAAATTEVAA
jgi:putative transposase